MFSLIPFSNADREWLRFADDMQRDFFGDAPARRGKDFSRPIRTDIKDAGDSYKLEAELPGFKKEDISVELSGDMLVISAQHSDSKDEKKENYICCERHYGTYKRSFDVSGVDAAKISGEYNDGVLELTLPKLKETKPESRKIALK